jgi:hypothetical protein
MAAPLWIDELVDVEVADGGVFDALHDLENMAPGQLRNGLLRDGARRGPQGVRAAVSTPGVTISSSRRAN